MEYIDGINMDQVLNYNKINPGLFNLSLKSYLTKLILCV